MTSPSPSPPDDTRPAEMGRGAGRQFRDFAGELFALRKAIPLWQVVLFGTASVALCFGIWWFLTRGEISEERIVSPVTLPSPAETFRAFPSLWFEQALTRNLWATLKRVGLGFGLAALVGVPLGVLCGCFTRLNAFFLPLTIFGRNIPIAALIPLTLSFFGIDEFQKVMFIFIACVAFVVSDTARAIADVGREYIDTAYTLGANRWQVIIKVLVPLAMPSIFNSLRLLFGLAFGYIMLAEVIKTSEGYGGIGYIITVSQHRGIPENILLILIIIPIVALAIDRGLFWVQRELFPHRYGGVGILNRFLGTLLRGWDDLKTLVFRRKASAELAVPRNPDAGKKQS